MICKKCGHDVTKYDVIYVNRYCQECKEEGLPSNVSEAHCPCGYLIDFQPCEKLRKIVKKQGLLT